MKTGCSPSKISDKAFFLTKIPLINFKPLFFYGYFFIALFEISNGSLRVRIEISKMALLSNGDCLLASEYLSSNSVDIGHEEH